MRAHIIDAGGTHYMCGRPVKKTTGVTIDTPRCATCVRVLWVKDPDHQIATYLRVEDLVREYLAKHRRSPWSMNTGNVTTTGTYWTTYSTTTDWYAA